MVEALQDAIRGHQLAYEAGIIHRDISEGNVFIAESAQHKGFIGDLDCSFNWKEWLTNSGVEATRENWEAYAHRMYILRHGQASRTDSVDAVKTVQWRQEHMLKGKTGTRHFMAVEILEETSVHEARHDLESFFWLLVWIVLRHTVHDRPGGKLGPTGFFYPVYEDQCPDQKRGWLGRWQPITVTDNRPLSFLIQELKELCRRNSLTSQESVVPLTYEVVLAKFHEALAYEDWPEDDAAIPVPGDEICEVISSVTAVEANLEPQVDADVRAPCHKQIGSKRCASSDDTSDTCISVTGCNPLSVDPPQHDHAKPTTRHSVSAASTTADLNTSPARPPGMTSSRSSSKRRRVDEDDGSPSKRTRQIRKQN